MKELKDVRLIFEDGAEFIAKSFGYEKNVSGELVFNTAMTGYPESLTDPSYEGQILVSSYPLVGNYGVPINSQQDGIFSYFESDKIHCKALIVSDYSFKDSHWNSEKSLGGWLKDQQIPGLFCVDTRALTKKLREEGSTLVKIIFDNKEDEIDFYNPNKENLVEKVSTKSRVEYGDGDYKIILVDCGTKNNIIRCLLKRNAKVIRVPWDYDFTKEDYDGVLLSNGPGNPEFCDKTVSHIKKSFAVEKPIFGICLGNQLLAVASGAETYKMKYGHRSHNQGVMKLGSNRCYITSQNHGFAVDEKSLSPDWEVLFTNVNDGSNEGIRHKTKPFFSVQFHPEASSGPTDTEFLFDDFFELVEQQKH